MIPKSNANREYFCGTHWPMERMWQLTLEALTLFLKCPRYAEVVAGTWMKNSIGVKERLEKKQSRFSSSLRIHFTRVSVRDWNFPDGYFLGGKKTFNWKFTRKVTADPTCFQVRADSSWVCCLGWKLCLTQPHGQSSPILRMMFDHVSVIQNSCNIESREYLEIFL